MTQDLSEVGEKQSETQVIRKKRQNYIGVQVLCHQAPLYKYWPKTSFLGMSYFFDAGVVGAWHLSNSYVISVALWVVSLCFAVVCAVTWELLGDTPDSLVPTTPMSFALSIVGVWGVVVSIVVPRLDIGRALTVPWLVGSLIGRSLGWSCWRRISNPYLIQDASHQTGREILNKKRKATSNNL